MKGCGPASIGPGGSGGAGAPGGIPAGIPSIGITIGGLPGPIIGPGDVGLPISLAGPGAVVLHRHPLLTHCSALQDAVI